MKETPDQRARLAIVEMRKELYALRARVTTMENRNVPKRIRDAITRLGPNAEREAKQAQGRVTHAARSPEPALKPERHLKLVKPEPTRAEPQQEPPRAR